MAYASRELDLTQLPAEVREYAFVKHIQSGAFGSVWHAATPDGQQVAVKVQTRQMHMIEHERAMLDKLKVHKHVVEPVLSAKADSCAVLVTELCKTDLLQVIASSRRVALRRAVKLFRELLVAVKHMHANNVYHCDLKPENVLLAADGTVKLCDFGASAHGTKFSARNLGSPQYICPELFTWTEGHHVGLAASDVWSLGVIFFTMLAGYQPWSRPLMSDIHFSHFVGGSMTFPAHFSPATVRFCKAMLQLDPNRRYTIDQLLACRLMQPRSGLEDGMDEAALMRMRQLDRVVTLPLPSADTGTATGTATAPAKKPVATGTGSCGSGSRQKSAPAPLVLHDADHPRCGSLESKESVASSAGSPRSCGTTPQRLSAPRYVACQAFLDASDGDDSDEDEAPYAVSPRVTTKRDGCQTIAFVLCADGDGDIDMCS